MEKGIFSVTQINEYLKMLFDGDRLLSNVFVRGEISNYKPYSSGHVYFTLKDPTGQLKAVMFRTYAAKLKFRPMDGMRVIAHGRVSVYEANGQYQLYADELVPDGIGSLALQYEQMRQKLAEEGLFDEERKRPLPPMPMRIGVITSPSGAAVHDIINVLSRRFSAAQMILFPAQVQGAEAPEQLIAGLEFFQVTGLVDVIILGRGGGSAEDLWAFNDERLARAVAACTVPVISAVGHESDFTICDFVADRRAPTPSAAAELAVPETGELLRSLRSCASRMQNLMEQKIARETRSLNQLAQARIFTNPERLLDGFRMKLTEGEAALERGMTRALEQKRHLLLQSSGKLEALNPLSVLSRGYAAVSRNGEVVLGAGVLSKGDLLDIRFADGEVCARVEMRKEEKNHGKENDVL